MFLTPRQALSSHPRQQMVWLYWLQDSNSMSNWYTINHPSTLHTHTETQWPTAARLWHFALRYVSRRQINLIDKLIHKICEFHNSAYFILGWMLDSCCYTTHMSHVLLLLSWWGTKKTASKCWNPCQNGGSKLSLDNEIKLILKMQLWFYLVLFPQIFFRIPIYRSHVV